jgi:hypothetical protein
MSLMALEETGVPSAVGPSEGETGTLYEPISPHS